MFDIHNHAAEITGLNVRRELHGDTNVVAVDISLTVSVHRKLIEALDPDVSLDLWTAGKPTKLLGAIGLGFQATTADVSLDDLEFEGVRIKKPKATLEQGERLQLALKIQAVPDDAQWVLLRDLFQRGDCDLSIRNAQLDLFGAAEPEEIEEVEEAEEAA